MPLIKDKIIDVRIGHLKRSDNGDIMELRNLIHPTKTMLIALIILSATILGLVFLAGWEESVFGPLLYAIPFYTLVLTCTLDRKSVV